MYNKSVLNNYKQTQISTASPARLVLMLYDGGVKFLGLAKQAIVEKRYDAANNNIVKTQRIINELSIVLNLEAGGDIAKNLWKLYDYMAFRLIDINLKKDAAGIDEVVRMLEQLREVWNSAILREATAQVPQAAAGGGFGGLDISS